MPHLRFSLPRSLLSVLLAATGATASAATGIEALQAACKADSAPSASLDQVQVSKVAATPGDLPYYDARSAATGSSVRLYYALELDATASSKAACLIGMLDLLAARLPHMRGAVVWSAIVLTRDGNYIPPKRDGELRWPSVFVGTAWAPDNMRFLLNVMPHEEAHLSQAMGGASLPRWFAEGHAEWVGLQVTEQIDPALAAATRAGRAEAARRLDSALLGAWGGLRVKSEAIERQLSAADRARRDSDPNFVPPGPFSFGPGDFAEDNTDEAGRYGAALALFTGLEQRHGRAAVAAWVRAVLEEKEAARILPLAARMLGEDLAPMLR